MYINKVISYMDSWNLLNEEFNEEFKDIIKALDLFYACLLNQPDQSDTLPRVPWAYSIESQGWDTSEHVTYSHERRTSFATLGPIKNGVSAAASSSTDVLGRWLFQRSGLAVRLGLVRLPILLLPTADYAEKITNRFIKRITFEQISNQIQIFSPLSHTSRFLILGYSDSNTSDLFSRSIYEVPQHFNEQNRVFDRFIEFPPEYHQAGIGILNFFGTYLRKKYPNADAIVRIEQRGLRVRLIIEGCDGIREVVEKALHEYELIVSNQSLPTMFTANDELILELKQELRIAQVRIEAQKDIFAIQNSRIDNLMEIIGAGLSRPVPLTVDFRPTITLSTNQQINQAVSSAIASLEDLKELVPPASQAQLELEDVQQSLESIERERDPAKVKTSVALAKFRAFLDRTGDVTSSLKKVIDTTEKGWDTIQRLATKYNKIAEWCGLPQVPSIFTK